MVTMSAAPSTKPDAELERLIRTFEDCFYQRYNTRLICGDDEPIYLPANQECPYHRIVFAHGFFASAMHEIAHWCIAGEQRRQQIDYGYWYEPDGRTAPQQQLFERVEVKPQALEWILMKATGRPFRVSVDNLNGEATDSEPFKDAVYQQVLSYCQQGLSERQDQLRQALAAAFSTPVKLLAGHFSRQELSL